MEHASKKQGRRPRTNAESVVQPLRFEGDDEELVRALRADHPGAYEELYKRYAYDVHRMLMRVMGPDAELEELLHDVFVRAFCHVASIRDPARLLAWLSGIAIFTARGAIRKRKRGNWLHFFAPAVLPTAAAPAVDNDARRALRCTYALLDRLSAENRIAFTLRYVDGKELTEVAELCGVSVATVKRRLSGAKNRFFAMAKNEPELEEWINHD